MKIISFPHYTCGGLLCDILNGTYSKVGKHGGLMNTSHRHANIGDSPTVLTQFDTQLFFDKIQKANPNQWIGTHCWLGEMDLDERAEIINITTMTNRSRIYRWARAWYHYYLPSNPWQNLQGIQEIDKQRETAKNYLLPSSVIFHKTVTNLEFAEVVECSPRFRSLMKKPVDKHITRWKQVNNFLYSDDFWTSRPVQRFYEAEYEVSLNQSYVYK
jgi:hypothetical protein